MANPPNPQRPGTSGFKPEIARRPPTPLPTGPGGETESGKKLIVGREIELNGEITACDTLVVEGRVQATLNHARSVEILKSGVFSGTATVEGAEISGRFEGDLTVEGRLSITASGRVIGKIRYRQLEVESGGRLSGEIELIESAGTEQRSQTG